jgi:hypothetical protein|tara:strand:+ start:1370 stop:2002 length:633 start_codon:yes stop_codon:yes gene_type:complete
MNKATIKWVGVSLLVGGTIYYLYTCKSNKKWIEEKPMISYTSYYDLTDIPEHYEHYQQKDKSIHETTPAGDVIVVYNKDTNQFIYYSNSDIPYRYLEVVVRKYVLTYNCTDLYTDIQKVFNAAVKEHQERQHMTKEDQNIKETKQVDNVFIQYKHYNVQQYKQNNNNIPIKQDYIQFKRGGTIREYKQQTQVAKPIKTIGFGEFKNKVSQ